MSTILVNTLTGTSTAGSIAVTGEGNSTTTNLQQGLAKAWAAIDPNVIDDSFNVASLTDVATGDFDYNFTSVFNSKDYSTTGGKQNSSSNNSDIVAYYVGTDTSTTRQRYYESGGTLRDPANANVTVHGDLA